MKLLENKIPTNQGDKTVAEIMDGLMWGSYSANRGYGMTHEQLISLGIGNDAMKFRYDSKDYTEQQIIN